jgi:outer membrane immunogenic protein
MAKLSKVVAVTTGIIGLFGAVAPASADGYGGRGYAAPFSWNGFYVGINGGYAWGDSDYRHTPTGAWLTPAIDPSVPQLIRQGSGTLDPSGFLGGVQAGHNWQFGNIVLGLEADFQGGRVSDSRTATNPNPVVPGTTLTFSEKLDSDWLFTLRPRAGIAFGRTLIYATGGLAVQDVRFKQSVFFSASGSTAQGWGREQAVGWTVGGGLEHAIAGSWSVKLEYLYVDLPDVTANLTNNVPGFFPFTHKADADLTEHIVRVGLNWKWDDRRDRPLK